MTQNHSYLSPPTSEIDLGQHFPNFGVHTDPPPANAESLAKMQLLTQQVSEGPETLHS